MSGWLVLIALQPNLINLIASYAGFLLLGVVGAVFANATGAGGGVVFVPFFNQLNFSPESVVATSFAIQCCGMTAGAVTWHRYYRHHTERATAWRALPGGLMLTIPASLCGIWAAQYGGHLAPSLAFLKGNLNALHLGFGVFSIILALAIFASIPLLRKTAFVSRFTQADVLVLPFVAFIGGTVTAWLSVGVGELVAVYLIMRGFSVTMSIALAVILSAASVWGAIAYHMTISQAIVWEVVMFAGAGAVIGGILAKRVVLAFSPTRLKLFFGAWVLVLGASGLPVF
ncbi:sulfite exporter TauE/SafE family protein [Alteromonas sp. ASW11-19]|uniref:Probable membrane transporter protein n=1 Tax=Alteromonas salexigens TaxID=2982530 RepID=A0ABT2VSE9_9ALTE|nr:sulfite exporter TauE/SafE family protein [Alteromonas salexigens]MCU7555984.1 sulfite exporter TauE/SafE family protein [Alteromonas salexigens]